jgi:hypothetical protein
MNNALVEPGFSANVDISYGEYDVNYLKLKKNIEVYMLQKGPKPISSPS